MKLFLELLFTVALVVFISGIIQFNNLLYGGIGMIIILLVNLLYSYFKKKKE